MPRFLRLPLLAFALLAAAPAAHADLCFVTTAGTSANDGSAWSQSMDLQTALGTSTCTTIWVAKGVYKPTAGADRTISFAIPPGVQVYGGFSGSEDSSSFDPAYDPDRAANVAANLTVLSGDLNGDDSDVDSGNGVDASVSANNGDNSYTIVSIDGTTTAVTSGTVLDGFTITGGNGSYGGGLYCNGQGGTCSPSLRHLVFSGNYANYGGAMRNDGQNGGVSSPTLDNVTFSGNQAFSGGAIYNIGYYGESSPTLTNVAFSNNRAELYGGAMVSDGEYEGVSSPALTNVTFSGNETTQSNYGGGAMHVDCRVSGGVTGGVCNPTLTNVTFSNNISAGYGGGILIVGFGGTSSSAAFSNVILWGNAAAADNNFAFSAGTTPSRFDHSIVQGSGGSGAGWVTAFGTDNGGNLDADPKLGALADNGGATQTLLPGSGSAAIDAGSCTSAVDQRGIARPQGLGCDIGAVEVVQSGSIGRCYVWASATGANDGTSWTDAYTDLQNALNNLSCTEVWVAQGVYIPVQPADPANPTYDDADVSFNVRPGLAVYGGFAGTETSRDQRNPDPIANGTVLSGDLAHDDCGGSGCPGGVDTDHSQIAGLNSYRVLRMDGTTAAGTITASTVLDGFTITAAGNNGHGGGFYCNGAGSGHECSPTLRNLVFSANDADNGGSAIYDNGEDGGVSSPTLTHVLIAYGYGTAMVNDASGDDYGGTSSPTLSDVTFNGNVGGEYGGAIYNVAANGGTSNPTLTNVTLYGNSATYGGAIVNADYDGGSVPSLINVTFNGNTATSGYGGAIYNYGVDPVLHNVILWGDTGSAEIYNFNAEPSIDHSIVQGSGGSGAGWNALLGSDGGGNLDADPVLGALANNGGFTQTVLPGTGSVAIDAGTCTGAPPTDQRGVVRPQGAACDIGAVEVVAAAYTVGGSASGLTGNVVLELDGTSPSSTQQLTVASGAAGFTFAMPLAAGSNWDVFVFSAPPDQFCVLVNANGTAIAANVTTVALTCSTIAIAIAPPTLPDATYGVAYSQALTASSSSGATAPYSFSLASGTLPPGFTLTADGTISGTPSTVGSYAFTVQATSSNAYSGTQSYTLVVDKKSTTIALSATPNPATAGNAVTITATLAGDPPSGSVSFTDNGAALACSPTTLIAGAGSSTAQCSATFTTTGTHTLGASYGGDADYAPATATPFALMVDPPGTTAPAPAVGRLVLLLLGTLMALAGAGRVRGRRRRQPHAGGSASARRANG
ncbi:MAG: choice-of-anchor Q domain-containing protein [Rudaea sp.]|uniref:choice-of-anchor Q domain-containing protein n=1 Tax=Rudaea sp. TaxID=2136325 RepID=UPI0039E6ED4E